jgi:hypothetical protein
MENTFAKYQGISACWIEKCTFSIGIVAIAQSRFPGLFVLPQVPLCRIDQAKTISLIGLEVPALGTLAGLPPRGVSGSLAFSAGYQPMVANKRKI